MVSCSVDVLLVTQMQSISGSGFLHLNAWRGGGAARTSCSHCCPSLSCKSAVQPGEEGYNRCTTYLRLKIAAVCHQQIAGRSNTPFNNEGAILIPKLCRKL